MVSARLGLAFVAVSVQSDRDHNNVKRQQKHVLLKHPDSVLRPRSQTRSHASYMQAMDSINTGKHCVVLQATKWHVRDSREV